MATVRYRGFDIVSRPYQISESGQWTVDLQIRRNDRFRDFGVTEHYPSEEEAERQCIGLGRRIIEGRVKGWSVDPLRAGNSLGATLRRFFTSDLAPVLVVLAALLGLGRAIMRVH